MICFVSKIIRLATCLCLVLVIAACTGSDIDEMVSEGNSYLEGQNYQGAIVVFKNVLEKDPSQMAARLGLGRAYLMSGKLELAEKTFEKYQKQNPYDTSVLLDVARLHAAMGRINPALDNLNAFIKAVPDSAEGYEALGIIETARKNYTAAETALNKALQIEPGRVKTNIALAKMYVDQKRFDDAQKALALVFEKDPTNKGALYIDAAVAAAFGDDVRLRKTYAIIAEHYPDEAFAQYMVAKAMLSDKEYDKALAIAQTLEKKFPSEPYAAKIRGMAAFFRGSYIDSIRYLRTALTKRREIDTYYYLGLSHYGEKDLESALTELRYVADGAPKDTRALEMISLIYLQQRRLKESIVEAEKLIAINPDNAVARSILSDAYIVSGDTSKALTELDKISEIRPEDYSASIKKGQLYLAQGDMKNTEEAFQEALQSAPDVVRPRLILASFYVRSGKRDSAMRILEEGISGKKTDAPLYYSLASIHLMNNDRKAAVELLDKAKAADASDPASYSVLASIRLAENDPVAALAEYDALLAKRPAYLGALLEKAAIYEAMGKQAESDANYQEAMKSGSAVAYRGYAASLAKRGEMEEALKTVELGLAQSPFAGPLLGLKADLLLRLKRYDDALSMCRELEARQENSSVGLEIKTRMMMGDHKGALRVAKQFSEFSPKNPEGYQAVSRVHLEAGEPDQAIAALEEGLTKVGPEPPLLLALGRLHTTLGNHDKAIAYIDAALKKDPKLVIGYTAKGDVLLAQGKRDKAVENYTKALEITEAFVPALNNLAMIYADMPGKAPESLRLAYTAYTRAPWNPAVLDTFGYSFMKNGKNEEAVKVLEKAVGISGNNAATLYHLALAYNATGQNDKARATLQECLKHADSQQTELAQTLLNSL